MKHLIAWLVVVAACGSERRAVPPPTPTRSTPLPTRSAAAVAAEPTVIARQMVTKLAAGDVDAAMAFASEQVQARADELRQIWPRLVEPLGAFQRIGATEAAERGELRLVTVTLEYARGPLRLVVTVDHTGHVVGLRPASAAPTTDSPPAAYDRPASYDETAVTVGANPALPGTLTRPHGAGPFAGVVLVHGSGPNSADEVVGDVKVFADLAHGLASRGIAVLRYDKRSLVDPRGVVTQHDEVDVAAHQAVALLRSTPGLDARRIVLLGHSQGGYLAPRIAKDDPDVRALVICAGPTRPLEDSLLAQLHYLLAQAPGNTRIAALIPRAEQFRKQVEDPALAPRDAVPIPTGGVVTGAYFLDVAGYHPEQVAASLAIPIAVLQGGGDYKVTIADDLPAWRAALAGRKGAAFFTYPALTHAFAVEAGMHVDAKVIDDLATWITALPK